MMSTTSTYQAFSKDFASYQELNARAGPSKSTVHLDSRLPKDAVLGEEQGLVVSLLSSLEDQIRSRETGGWEGEDAMTPDEKDALLKEHRTWQLFRTVYSNRLSRRDSTFEPSSATAELARNPYITPEDLMQYMVDEDDELSLYATLVEHLQTRPLLNSSPPLEARHGYLPSTLRRTKAAKANNQPTPASLDPDFTLRDPHGQGLAGEDLTYENPLLETLWDLVRHGELDRAIEVCEQGGEPWRAATLMGGRRWTMPGLTTDSMDEEDHMGDVNGGLEGNRKRALWKKTCRAMAKNPTLPAAERHLYAALISDLPNLYGALDTWEDLLWANVQYKMEARLERRWKELGGFWQEQDSQLGEDAEFAGISSGGMDDIFAAIGAVQKHEVQTAKRDPYIVAQKMIILGRTDALFDQFVDLLGQIQETVAEELIGPLIRFYAHLVLALRTLGETVPEAAANAIIQAYLKILEIEGHDHLVAAYAACLRQGSGEESYARFLRTMDSNATKETRREALLRARQHNLDVAAIAKETVRMILEHAFADVPALSRIQPDVSSLATGLDERDVYLIRSVEWLTFLVETADEALIKSNAVGRYFLALGQAGAAQSLYRTLPNNIHHVFEEGDSERDEYEDYQLLFGVFACHDLVDEVLSRRPKETASKLEHHNWSKNLAVAIDRVYDSTVHLLTNEWLQFAVPKSEISAQRKRELRRIRQIFIPDLIMRLHSLLLTHHQAFPVLLSKALDLTKTVASEEYGVYAEFLGQDNDTTRLAAYLDKIREASLLSLELEAAKRT